MKTLTGKITMSMNAHDGLRIEINDEASVTQVIRLHMSAEDAFAMLSGHARQPCEFLLMNAGKAGKRRETRTLEFPLEKNMCDREEIAAVAQTHLPDGWEIIGGFSNQNTFFQKDGEPWARTTIARWIE